MGFLKQLFTLGRNEIYDEAISLYNRYRYKEAIALFETILQKASRTSLHYSLAGFYCGQAHLNLGVMQYAAGNFSGALNELQRALYYNPESLDLHLFIGICQNNLGQFNEAVHTFQTILEADPASASIRLKLGISLHNLQMWDRAAEMYRAILERNPHYADVHYRLGLACLGKGDTREAIRSFLSALEINPRYVNAHIKLGIAQTYIGDFAQALDTFTALIDQNPDFADLRYYAAIASAGMNRVDDAIDSFRQALRINPEYIEAKIKLGILYCRTGNIRAALDELKGAGLLDPHNPSLEKLIETVTGIAGKPHSPEQLSEHLSSVLGGEKPLAQTIQEFNKHIKIIPDMSDIMPIIKHFTRENTQLCEMLLSVIDEHIAQHPEYPDLHNTRGVLLIKLGRLQSAEVSFREAVRIAPEYRDARINLAKALNDTQKFQEAAEHAAFLMERGVVYPDVCCAAGQAHLALSDVDRAAQCARKALETNKHYPHAHLLRAQIHERRGEPAEAIAAYGQCLACNPSPEIRQQAEEGTERLRRER